MKSNNKRPWLCKTINIGILQSACVFSVRNENNNGLLLFWSAQQRIHCSTQCVFRTMNTAISAHTRCFGVDNIFSTCNFLIHFVYRTQWPITSKTSKQTESKRNETKATAKCRGRGARQRKIYFLFIDWQAISHVICSLARFVSFLSLFFYFCVCCLLEKISSSSKNHTYMNVMIVQLAQQR